jgi:hypothetical protein
MKMYNRWMVLTVVFAVAFAFAVPVGAGDMEIGGVTFPGEKVVAGKQLQLNGVAIRKALGFVKVFCGGFYLENPTKDAKTAIESEQVKQFYIHYLTSQATAEKLQEGFIEAIEEANSPALVQAQQKNIQLYASWLDKDMAPGMTSIGTYVPGKGLTLTYQGVEKGTISDPDFVRMYFIYNLGKDANKKLRQGYLGQ